MLPVTCMKSLLSEFAGEVAFGLTYWGSTFCQISLGNKMAHSFHGD